MSILPEIEDFIDFLDCVLGRDGGVVLDTGIIRHCGYEAEHDRAHDFFSIGEKGRKITFQDVICTFKAIEANEILKEDFHSGRSFWFSSIAELKDGLFVIHWDS